MEEILSVKDITVEYPKFTLNDISFNLHGGEIVGLVGENGAGKSTTIKAIMGMVDYKKGEIRFKGNLIRKADMPAFKQKIGYVGDAELYYPKVKVKHLLKFLSELYDDWDLQYMYRYLDILKIDTEKTIIQLSMGMRVKLEIVIALSHHAQIYILDEPTSGLDPVIRREVLNILLQLKREGKAVLLSSHITGDLEKIADRIIYIVEGRILLNEKKEILQKKYSSLEDVLFSLSQEENNEICNSVY